MRSAVCLFMMLLGTSAGAAEFVSGPTRTHLLELFTSEGCSSCPPAEAWLSDAGKAPGLWRDFVPIAWHVNYWDHLGWKDRYSSREATARQYAYASGWQTDSVYTPCFVLDGREWRTRTIPARSTETTGVLRVQAAGGQVNVSFTPDGADAPDGTSFEAHAVMLSLGVMSRIGAGENRGRSLRHDFVAIAPPRRALLQNGRGTIALDIPEDTAERRALVVWITRAGELTPLQATGGNLAN